MRYNTTKLNDGTYAVSAGRQSYFVDTIRDTEKEAQKEALIMSLRWYKRQLDKAELLLIEDYDLEYRDINNLLA